MPRVEQTIQFFADSTCQCTGSPVNSTAFPAGSSARGRTRALWISAFYSVDCFARTGSEHWQRRPAAANPAPSFFKTLFKFEQINKGYRGAILSSCHHRVCLWRQEGSGLGRGQPAPGVVHAPRACRQLNGAEGDDAAAAQPWPAGTGPRTLRGVRVLSEPVTSVPMDCWY